jgi:hypothetical protein
MTVIDNACHVRKLTPARHAASKYCTVQQQHDEVLAVSGGGRNPTLLYHSVIEHTRQPWILTHAWQCVNRLRTRALSLSLCASRLLPQSSSPCTSGMTGMRVAALYV